MIPNPITPYAPTAVDPDWEATRRSVIAQIAQTVPESWSDHNIPDPGITLAEAAAFGLADLHFRMSEADFAGWPIASRAFDTPAERHWYGTLPEPGAAVSLAQLATKLAPVADELEGLVRACPTPADANGLLATPPWSSIFTAPQRPSVIGLLRWRLVRQLAFEQAHIVSDAVEAEAAKGGNESEQDARAAAEISYSLPLWPQEIAALVRRERRRLHAEMVEAHRGEIAKATTAAAVAEVKAKLTEAGLPDAEAKLAAASGPLPLSTAPEDFERGNGASLVWPPHAIQALTSEPVTNSDYAKRARLHTGVKRAWAVPGRLAGIAWHGLPVAPKTTPSTAIEHAWAEDDAAAAVTLVIDANVPEAEQDEYLRAVLKTAIGGEVRDPFPLWHVDPSAPSAHRVICDEVGATLVKRVAVIVEVTLLAAVTVDKPALVQDINRRISEFFERGRPESQPAPEASGVVEGPWPPPPPALGGWIPGEPIRFTEVVERIVSNPEVLGIRDLTMNIAGKPPVSASTSASGALPLPRDAIPFRGEGNCLTVSLVTSGGCGDA